MQSVVLLASAHFTLFNRVQIYPAIFVDTLTHDQTTTLPSIFDPTNNRLARVTFSVFQLPAHNHHGHSNPSSVHVNR